MPWPTMTDYQDALQNPGLSFMDPDLKRGVPVTDRLGLPKPVTGGFASVYQVHSGGRTWAVRCFLRYHQDTAQRYAVIGRYLRESRLPYMASFQFLEQGIRIRDKWYPVLKMEWVEGETLNVYVEKNRHNPEALRRLADQFVRMTRDLRQAGIAHGDLQHGNVLVVGGNLKLVDYDGMFVPALSGMPSHEVGHPNYQHPKRNETDFGPYLDNFSEWVIHISLVALSVRPDLWELAGGGDEQLLFSRKDFIDPGSSRVLRALADAGDHALRQLASDFLSVLACPDIARIPPVDGLKAPLVVAARTASMHEEETHETRRDNSLPDWLYDHIEPEEVEIGPPFVIERASMAGFLFLVATLARFAVLGYFQVSVATWGSLAGAVCVSAVLVLRYRARPEFVSKSSVEHQIGVVKAEMRQVERALREVQRDRERLAKHDERETGAIVSRLNTLSAQEIEEAKGVDVWLDRFVAGLRDRRDALDKAEADELAAAVKNTPAIFLAPRATGIVRKYKRKREDLARQEERVNLEAAKRKDSIRGKYEKMRAPLEKRLEEVRQAFDGRRRSLDSRQDQETQRLNLQKWSLQNLSRELTLYRQVTFAEFVKRVVFLKKSGPEARGTSAPP